MGSSITKELIILSKADLSLQRPLRGIIVLFGELCIFILVQLHKRLDKFYCLQNDSLCVLVENFKLAENIERISSIL